MSKREDLREAQPVGDNAAGEVSDTMLPYNVPGGNAAIEDHLQGAGCGRQTGEFSGRESPPAGRSGIPEYSPNAVQVRKRFVQEAGYAINLSPYYW